MDQPELTPSSVPLAPSEPPAPIIVLTRGEFLWITFGTWLGGVFILTLLPILFIPRFGMPLGVAASYLVFFLAWQPVQTITQRTMGVRSAVLRMVLLVGAAATAAFYLREVLLSMR